MEGLPLLTEEIKKRRKLDQNGNEIDYEDDLDGENSDDSLNNKNAASNNGEIVAEETVEDKSSQDKVLEAQTSGSSTTTTTTSQPIVSDPQSQSITTPSVQTTSTQNPNQTQSSSQIQTDTRNIAEIKRDEEIEDQIIEAGGLMTGVGNIEPESNDLITNLEETPSSNDSESLDHSEVKEQTETVSMVEDAMSPVEELQDLDVKPNEGVEITEIVPLNSETIQSNITSSESAQQTGVSEVTTPDELSSNINDLLDKVPESEGETSEDTEPKKADEFENTSFLTEISKASEIVKNPTVDDDIDNGLKVDDIENNEIKSSNIASMQLSPSTPNTMQNPVPSTLNQPTPLNTSAEAAKEILKTTIPTILNNSHAANTKSPATQSPVTALRSQNADNNIVNEPAIPTQNVIPTMSAPTSSNSVLNETREMPSAQSNESQKSKEPDVNSFNLTENNISNSANLVGAASSTSSNNFTFNEPVQNKPLEPIKNGDVPKTNNTPKNNSNSKSSSLFSLLAMIFFIIGIVFLFLQFKDQILDFIEGFTGEGSLEFLRF